MKCGVPPKNGREYCYHCGTKARPEAVVCTHCGQSVGSVAGGGGGGSGQTNMTASSGGGWRPQNLTTSGWWSDHFNFRTFITPTIIKALYMASIIIAVLIWLFVTFSAFAGASYGGRHASDGPVVGIIVFIVGAIVCAGAILYMRLAYELIIVFFRTYEELRDFRMQKSRER